MTTAHKGAISFGLVHIPVALYTAAQDNDISFHMLHKEDNSRIKYKKVCSHCGKEVKNEDIVKGFQYEKDGYVTVTDAEIEKIKTERDKTIYLYEFCQLNEISPVYYDKAYHVTPEKGGGKALELLRQSMMELQKVGLGKSVFGAKEKLLLLIPREDGMLLQTLLFQEDIKAIPTGYEKPAPAPSELSMAKTLIESMLSPFEPAKYEDEFQKKLKALIDAKIDGKELAIPSESSPEKALSLMDALKQSLSHIPKAPPKKGYAAPVRKKA